MRYIRTDFGISGSILTQRATQHGALLFTGLLIEKGVRIVDIMYNDTCPILRGYQELHQPATSPTASPLLGIPVTQTR